MRKVKYEYDNEFKAKKTSFTSFLQLFAV